MFGSKIKSPFTGGFSNHNVSQASEIEKCRFDMDMGPNFKQVTEISAFGAGCQSFDRTRGISHVACS
jgi:hypothetical protein